MSNLTQETRGKAPKRRFSLGTLGLAIICAGSAYAVSGCAPEPHSAEADSSQLEGEAGMNHAFAVTIRKPLLHPAIKTGTFDEKGNPVTIACANCHTTKPANLDAKVGTPLVLFHQGLVGKHGNLSCASCHNPAEGYASLRLADGKSVPFTEVMTLCAQCHGPQFRDYEHGAHGGMTGYWDLKKGGRVRNNCVDCHDSHSPKYPTVIPAPGPRDRFLTGDGHE